MDAVWAGRSLINYNDFSDSRHFDHENFDRLDYFIKVLKEQGIYIYLDLHVSRKFKDADGINNADTLPYDGKGVTIIDPILIDLQKEYAKGLWTHINPYTGLRYLDDPVFALCLLTNENDLTTHFFLTPENTKGHKKYANMFKDRLDSFSKAQSFSKIKTRKVWDSREMSDYLRRIGVRIPICLTNWAHNLYDLPALSSGDYIDQHIYADADGSAADFTTSPFEKPTSLQRYAFARMAGKPFIVSEWNKAYPNQFRAEYPLVFAALAAFQQWNGAVLYAYSHDNWVNSYLHHPFDVIVDPARLPLLPIAALLYRQAVQFSPDHEVVTVDLEKVFKGEYQPADLLAYRTGLWQNKLSLSWAPPINASISPFKQFKSASDHFLSVDKQLYWNWKEGYRLINTPMAQCFIGIGLNMVRKTSDVIFIIENQFAVVAVAALGSAGHKITEADTILVSVAANSINNDQIKSRQNMAVSSSASGILSQEVTGKIMIRHKADSLYVETILSSGKTSSKSPLFQNDAGYWVLPLLQKNNAIAFKITVSP